MRALTRFLVNLVFVAGTLAAIGAAITSPAYQHAPRGTQITALAGIAAAAFVLAWFVLAKVIPARKKTPPRTSFYAAAPARRGR